MAHGSPARVGSSNAWKAAAAAVKGLSMIWFATVLATALAILITADTVQAKMVMQTFAVLAGAGAHDVYPAADGTVWFTAQSAGKLGRLDAGTGKSDLI